jgi:hypothetical protein
MFAKQKQITVTGDTVRGNGWLLKNLDESGGSLAAKAGAGSAGLSIMCPNDPQGKPCIVCFFTFEPH